MCTGERGFNTAKVDSHVTTLPPRPLSSNGEAWKKQFKKLQNLVKATNLNACFSNHFKNLKGNHLPSNFRFFHVSLNEHLETLYILF